MGGDKRKSPREAQTRHIPRTHSQSVAESRNTVPASRPKPHHYSEKTGRAHPGAGGTLAPHREGDQ